MSDDEQNVKRQKLNEDEEDEEAIDVEDEGEVDPEGDEEYGEEDEEEADQYGGTDSGVGEDDDEDVERALGMLESVQEELEKINDEASDKVLEVEQRFNEVRRPVFQQRNEVIRQIPEFWVTAFCNHPYFDDFLTDLDKEVLSFLNELDVRDNQDVKSGYVITFKWLANPYFSDEELRKEFKFADDGTLTVMGQVIDWKHGMNITETDTQESMGHVVGDSFFKWFQESDSLPGGLQDEIAVAIKDDLWLDPLKYFNGEGDEPGMEDPEEAEEFYEEGKPLDDEDDREDEEGDDEEFAEEEGDDEGYLEGEEGAQEEEGEEEEEEEEEAGDDEEEDA